MSNDFSEAQNFTINGCQVINTCEGCPEQYDVFKNGKQIGYIRYRWGYFTAYFPDCDGNEVFRKPAGGSLSGEFYSDAKDRENYLTAGVNAILYNYSSELLKTKDNTEVFYQDEDEDEDEDDLEKKEIFKPLSTPFVGKVFSIPPVGTRLNPDESFVYAGQHPVEPKKHLICLSKDEFFTQNFSWANRGKLFRNKQEIRLPTLKELAVLFAYRDLIGGFDGKPVRNHIIETFYWSSLETVHNEPWVMCLKTGFTYKINLRKELCVRLVFTATEEELKELL